MTMTIEQRTADCDDTAVVAAVAVGSFSCAVNLTNNLRDIPSDTEAGKITLAVRLGDSGTRGLHAVLELLVPLLATLALIPATWWALRDLSDTRALRGPEDPVRVSPSKVAQFGECSLRWLLQSAGGDGPTRRDRVPHR